MHVMIVVLVIVLIFGAAKLPSVAKNLGKSMKVFKDEVKDMRSDDADAKRSAEITDAPPAAPASAPQADPAAEAARRADVQGSEQRNP
ncbi:twin-arginine translocase TatA/TatE family subunit [Brevibacterium sp. 5221]|uniref:Sec-independent protein translocase protein TatA n=2 Tax=Brevibacteriaceae TaxID=85019 RepID=A0A6N9H561_9MICO|nr:twin-arginine translocase TatA/TatE family subunit [Brevibacterium rongguiense]